MKKKLLLVLAVFLMVSCFLWSSLSADSLHVRKVVSVVYETCELYSLAAKHGIDALTIMTVSDNLIMSLKDVQPKSGRHPLTT